MVSRAVGPFHGCGLRFGQGQRRVSPASGCRPARQRENLKLEEETGGHERDVRRLLTEEAATPKYLNLDYSIRVTSRFMVSGRPVDSY